MTSARTIERPNTIAGLVEKHREIAGQIIQARTALNGLLADLEAVDLGRAKPTPGDYAAFKGEMSRDVMRALRAAAAVAFPLGLGGALVMGEARAANRPL
jgi:hypothetical protein